jgi:hypothetical protein
MLIVAGAGLAVIAVLAVAWFFIKRHESPSVNPYAQLREQALTVDAARVGIDPVEGRAWGAVMDLRVGAATATVVAFADGTASIYFSNGAGFIGGHQHETIRAAAKTFVDAATAALPVMRPAAACAPPSPGVVAFYARTAAVTLAAEADEARLQSAPSGPLAAMYAAGHGVITEYRQIAPAP